MTPVTTSDAYYEWLLSDQPQAREERRRRRAENRALGLGERAQVESTVAKVKANPGASDDVRRLAEIVERQLAGRAAREDVDDAFSDDLSVAVARERLESTRRVSGDDPDYRYPARYLGKGAADQPIPD